MSAGKKAAKLALYLVGAILLLLLAYSVARNTSDPTRIQDVLAGSENMFRVIRWTIIISIIGCWPFIVNFVAKAKGLSREQTLQMLSFRLKLAMYLLAFEILIVEAFPFSLLGG